MLPFVLTGIPLLAGVVLRALRLWTSGKPKPFVDEEGHRLPDGISEKIWVDINGVRQEMFIKGKERANPVLLHLHGGMPEYFLTARYNTGLEDHFTVCWWEQRGAGLSYNPDIPRETMTSEQLIADTLEVARYLRERFGQEKIYLMAHSGGTFFGIQAAARAPELFHAYIGMAQMVNQRESERMAYEYMLATFQAEGNRKMVRRLEAAPVTASGEIPRAYLAVRDQAMHTLGVGTARDITSVIGDLFWPSLRSEEYTLGEKIKTWRAKFGTGVTVLWDEVIATDLAEQLTELALPVYFFHGVYDYTCSYKLARAYFDRLTAPVKGFYSFEYSAHSPLFEEPERAMQILRQDVLTGGNSLADRG